MSEKLLGNQSEGLLFVVSAPAGTGKSTLVEMLLAEFPDSIVESCSCTTRRPRPREIAEHHYVFLSEREFEEKIANQEFLEYAQVFGNYYGTIKNDVFSLQSEGKHVILVIDVQGAEQIRRKNIPAIFIFISPPSMEELQRRLFARRTESEEKIQERLRTAHVELGAASSYDYHIINDNLQITYEILRSIFIAEEHRRRK